MAKQGTAGKRAKRDKSIESKAGPPSKAGTACLESLTFMRLADFILQNIEPILAEWEAFARSIWPGQAADPATLRDHAEKSSAPPLPT
jgi:hypothetical protein